MVADKRVREMLKKREKEKEKEYERETDNYAFVNSIQPHVADGSSICEQRYTVHRWVFFVFLLFLTRPERAK
jgi:hypothetical protein